MGLLPDFRALAAVFVDSPRTRTRNGRPQPLRAGLQGVHQYPLDETLAA